MEYTKEHPLRVFTAFSGYDSQCLAFERLKKKNPDFDYELIGWSEVEMNAIAAHNAIFPQYKDRNYGDISVINWGGVPDFDLFTYSFPCQSISAAGKQAGLEEGSGTRSSLLWECRKAIEAKRPKYLLMENVKALLQKKFKSFFLKWVNELDGFGYDRYYLTDKSLAYFSRVTDDKSHNHNFNPKKKTDTAFTVRCRAGSRVDDNFFIEWQ